VFLAQRRDTRVAVMVVDLDHFKQVNDALGPPRRRRGAARGRAPHRRLRAQGRTRWRATAGTSSSYVIPDLHQDGDCQVVARRSCARSSRRSNVDGRDFTIGASIGVSLYPTDAGDGEAVLRNADVAMYRAKQLGRNNYRFYGR
jgi:diguanylate cyclase (GGDEF)-like protein